MLNLEFLGWAGGNGDSPCKPNTYDARQVGKERFLFDISIALLLCSDSPSLPLRGNPANHNPRDLQAQEEALPACEGTDGKCADSTSDEQSRCWEPAVAT